MYLHENIHCEFSLWIVSKALLMRTYNMFLCISMKTYIVGTDEYLVRHFWWVPTTYFYASPQKQTLWVLIVATHWGTSNENLQHVFMHLHENIHCGYSLWILTEALLMRTHNMFLCISMKTYIVGTGGYSVRHFWWVPTTYYEHSSYLEL